MSNPIVISFDTNDLPTAPPGHRLFQVSFRTCPGSDLVLQVARDNSNVLDVFGMYQDSWWSIRCANLPDRVLRLFRGTHSVKQLVRRYGFMDSKGCVNHRDARAAYIPASAQLPSTNFSVPKQMTNAIGVPQFYATSGVCWFAALCTVSFANPIAKQFIKNYLPYEMQSLCDECLFDKTKAEELRKKLWYEYSIGDDVTKPPHMDGCNGFSEFTTLCAKLNIPLMRFKEDNGVFRVMPSQVRDKKNRRVPLELPDRSRQHFLVIRFQDGDHSRFPILRQMCFRKVMYAMVGFYGGQRKCGHQIGIASTTGSWKNMIIGDADLHKDGVGPIHIRFDEETGKDKWWQLWRDLVHVTKFGPEGSEFCNLSPHNEPDDSLDEYKYGRSVGMNSVDVLYISTMIPC